jgi:hypothetical protein
MCASDLVPCAGPAAVSPIRPAVTCGVAYLLIMLVGVPLGTLWRTQRDTHDRPRQPGPPQGRLPGTTRSGGDDPVLPTRHPCCAEGQRGDQVMRKVMVLLWSQPSAAVAV